VKTNGRVGRIPGNDRALPMLLQVAQGPGQSLAQVADALRMPRPSALRVLRDLEQCGWVDRDEGSGYSLGPVVLALARAYVTETPLLAAATGPVEALRDELGATVALSVVSGAWWICVHEARGPGRDAVEHERGRSGPLEQGAIGQLLLAHIAGSRRTWALETRIPDDGPAARERRAAIEHTCATIREHGYAVGPHDGDGDGDAAAIAVPVLVPAFDGETAYALTAFVPGLDPADDVERWVGALGVGAGRIERALAPVEA